MSFSLSTVNNASHGQFFAGVLLGAAIAGGQTFAMKYPWIAGGLVGAGWCLTTQTEVVKIEARASAICLGYAGGICMASTTRSCLPIMVAAGTSIGGVCLAFRALKRFGFAAEAPKIVTDGASVASPPAPVQNRVPSQTQQPTTSAQAAAPSSWLSYIFG